jgi:ABC-type branched-subunit amino acid transport system ATPase component/ABC-type branched-subunit amino acid transport system permease subunit
VLTGYAGQVSLGQFAFVALGALVGGRMAQLGYPPWVGVVYAAAAAGAAALVIGLAALRIRGLFLAVATLGFALAASTWLFAQPWLVVSDARGLTSRSIPRPELWGVDFRRELNYYWLCLIVFCVIAAIVHHLRHTGLGRAMMAVRDNERAAATLTISPRRAKLAAFTIAGMIAGVAGYFYGGLLVTFDPTGFGPEQSLTLVAMVIFGGVTTITGAVLGALWVRGIPYTFGANAGLLSSGAGVLLVLLLVPGGLASLVFRVRDLLVAKLTGRQPDAVDATPADAPRERLSLRVTSEPTPVETNGHRVERPPPLAATGICVHYGGVTAVGGVDLVAAHGEIVGLIGPNGAGKTTLFDVLSGQVRADEGRVELHGFDVTGLRVEQRARLGLARSFQQARLFGEMTLRDSLKVSLERKERSEAVPSLLGLPPSRRAERAKDQSVDDLIALFGLGVYADRRVEQLSTGTRRIGELACIVGLGADVLLLDEPTAGIAQREVEAFATVIRDIRGHLDATVVIVDHDIPMITGLVDRLYVMAQGVTIAQGEPSTVGSDPAVVAAYLGADSRAITRSGAIGALGLEAEGVVHGRT